jgi:hypothetical protein
MASLLIGTRTDYPAPWLLGPAQAEMSEVGRLGAKSCGAGALDGLDYVRLTAADCGEPAIDQWRAELELAGRCRALPLAWPLPDWLDDYRALLAAALADRPTRGSAWWAGAIRTFLQLVLAGRDKSAARFIRALARLHPLAEETRRIRRVQGLFASIRPARSLAEALDFRIVEQLGA